MEVRSARAEELSALVDLMYAEPLREAVALAGGLEQARRFQAELLAHAFADDGAVILVADEGGHPVGFAWWGEGADVPGLRQVAAMAVRAMGVRGALVAGWRSRARLAVDMRPPAGGRHLVELHVHADRRGQGIGGALLDAVEAGVVEAGGAHLSLTTGSTNPARHLYQRHEFEVVQERHSARYERLTGIPGRVLMVKDLRP